MGKTNFSLIFCMKFEQSLLMSQIFFINPHQICYVFHIDCMEQIYLTFFMKYCKHIIFELYNILYKRFFNKLIA